MQSMRCIQRKASKTFQGSRDVIAEALSNKHEPGVVVGNLPRHQGQALRTPDFRKQGSHTSFTSAAPSSFERKPSLDTDISSPGSIKKKLSFVESGNDEAVTSAAKDSATASQEPKASAEEQPATAAQSFSQIQQPEASAKKPSANASAPGSLTVVGHSTDERFRITYGARQLISGLNGSGSTDYRQ